MTNQDMAVLYRLAGGDEGLAKVMQAAAAIDDHKRA
jgi:hypothetical protein